MSGPESLRAAGRALEHWQLRQQVAAHNLANAETPGYRARRVFSEVLSDGVPRVGTRDDPRNGALRETGAPLDLALLGPGAFVVRSGDREELVRSGSFMLDSTGRIVDAQQRVLLGEEGSMVLPPGPVHVDARGGVHVGGELVGRLRIVSELGSAGTSAGDVVVRQGYLEESNVNVLDQLVELTLIQRSYEAVSNSVRTIDSVMDTIANRIGRLG